MYKIQILVPQYKENENIIKYLLNSIQAQNNIDFKNDISVIIVNDGSDIILSEKFLNKYDFKIDYYINNKNLGPSATRNICLNHATADYIMFCDADDMFLDNNALINIQKLINQKHFDLLYSSFLQENKNQEYILKEKDNTFVHGKIVNRNFLLNNNIKWKNELKVHEDSYFWGLCKSCTKNFYYYNKPFYLYKYNKNSTSQQDNDYILKSYSSFIQARTFLVQELLNRGKFDLAQKYALSSLYKFYFFLNEETWQNLDENKEKYLIIIKNSITKFLQNFYSLINNIDKKIQIDIFMNERLKQVKENKVIFTNFTLNDFIEELLKEDQK